MIVDQAEKLRLMVRESRKNARVLAVASGKGGVGKTTITAALALTFAENNMNVLVVDADPDANLASALGVLSSAQSGIPTIAAEKALIEERTGAKLKEYGQIFKLNPEVSDIKDSYAYIHRGVSLLVLGAIEGGGTGCACPESSLLRALVQDLVLHKNDLLLMDMEAGIEHLGRATARGVDIFLVVVEPGQRSVDSVKRITEMARQIGIENIAVIANRIRTADDERFIRDSLPGMEIIGTVPFSERLMESDRDGRSVTDGMGEEMKRIFSELAKTLQQKVLDRNNIR